MFDVTTFRTEGLGDSTYLLTFDGMAVLVDPQRDIDRFLEHLGGHELRWVLETHLHNDYVSGGLAAANRTGAELVMPAGAAPTFRHTPAFHREELTEGSLKIRPLHTPGHTPEHVSYVIEIDGREEAVFTGGSLLVGSAGRSDLLGEARAETLARLQYRSIRRLAGLPDETGLYPTHGAGSFCTTSEAQATTSTIGRERRDNPVLAAPNEDVFVAEQLSGLQPYPRYYQRMAPINLTGPAPMPSFRPEPVDPADVDAGATVVDIRSPARHAGGHFPGSINIPLSDQFGTWFGWLIPVDARVHLVADGDVDIDEALLQLRRIGIEDVAGVIRADGAALSGESRTGRVADIPPGAQILDVRSPGERADSGAPGTAHRYLPDLVEGPPEGLDPDQPVWVVCSSGYRSAIGASLLRRQGFEAVPVIDGGISDL